MSSNKVTDNLISTTRKAKEITILTGAGISTESGVPNVQRSPDWALGEI